jgi:hypothetical protein
MVVPWWLMRPDLKNPRAVVVLAAAPVMTIVPEEVVSAGAGVEAAAEAVTNLLWLSFLDRRREGLR